MSSHSQRITENQACSMALPLYCSRDYHDPFNCSVIPLYTIADIEGKMRFGQEKARPELIRHGHKSSLVIKKSGKQRNTKETVKELLEHYKRYHI